MCFHYSWKTVATGTCTYYVLQGSVQAWLSVSVLYSSFLTCVESDQICSAVLMHAVLKALCDYKSSYTMYIVHRVCISEKWFLENSFLTEALYSAQ